MQSDFPYGYGKERTQFYPETTLLSPSVALPLGFLVIIVAVVAIYRRFDVRLVLFLAALLLGTIAMQPDLIVDTFFDTFANERFVVPICCAMGFAYVLKHTECDQHLVHLLIEPLKKVRWALIPGTVLVAFFVNIPIISQTSTAATLGPVVIPILRKAKISMVTIGATLVLGCSIGGELLNPGAPELRTVAAESDKAADQLGVKPFHYTTSDLVSRIFPLDVLALVVATSIFWWQSARIEARGPSGESQTEQESAGQVAERSTDSTSKETIPKEDAAFRVNPFKAAIPLLPLVLLFLTGPPLNVIHLPVHWLVSPSEESATLSVLDGVGMEASGPTPAMVRLFSSRLIGAAMLVGVIVASIICWPKAASVPKAFFEGAGYAFGVIISLIVTANCFGTGIKLIGIADLIGGLIGMMPALLLPLSGGMSTGFGALSGSGMATTTSLFGFFTEPAIQQDVEPALVGAVVSISSAAGRTMSPVAAVMLMSSTLTNTNPFDLAKRVALPLIAGVVAVIIAAFVMSM